MSHQQNGALQVGVVRRLIETIARDLTYVVHGHLYAMPVPVFVHHYRSLIIHYGIRTRII